MTSTSLADILHADTEEMRRENGIGSDPDVVAKHYGFENWSALLAFSPYMGELTGPGTLTFQRWLPVDRRHIWQAVSDPAELSQWFMETTMEARIGGRFSFKHGWNGVVSALEPGSAIAFTADQGGQTRFEIADSDNGTRFHLLDRMGPGVTAPDGELGDLDTRQPGGPGTHWVGVAVGWHGFVDSLTGHLGAPVTTVGEHEMTLLYDRLLAAHFGSSQLVTGRQVPFQ
ncbi:MAG: SRPBCC domain-containing protein [Pseudomonadota bacterium]